MSSLAIGAALALLIAGPALADEPPRLGASPVYDSADVLEDPAAVERALDDAFERTGVSLFVAIVPRFESPADADEWSLATAELNGLGPDDVLLAIAIEDRTYSLSADVSTLDDAQFDAVAARVEASLRTQDWDGAVIGAADTIAQQLDPPFNPVPLAVGAGLVGAGALTVGGIAVARRRRSAAGVRASAQELDRRAGSLLVQLDDAVKTSEQELGFAIAQFGEEPATGFQTALAHAKTQLREAFELRQRLDDAQPESADERRTMTLRIIELCEAADAALDAEGAAFEELRALEANAPELVERLGAEQRSLTERVEASTSTVSDLESRYGFSAVDPIDENPAQARKLLAFADASLAKARDAVAASERSRAAVEVRATQQSLGQVVQLLEAIDKLAVALPELASRLSAATADTRADVAEARTANATGALDGVIAEAERVLSAIEGQDPTTALGAVEQVNAALNRELAAVREREAQVARATAQLGRVTSEAQAAVETARDYITTRRGAVGTTPRTRLAEAEKQLTHALSLQGTDPVEALTAAQQSARLAGSALSVARSEVTAFQSPGYGSRLDGDGFDGFDGDGDLGSAILGGILDSLLWSGSSGGSRRASSGWSSGRSSRSSSSSSRRSSGSRRSSSSGGRRSRGGRF